MASYEEQDYNFPAAVGAEIPEEFTRRDYARNEAGFMQMALLSKPGRLGAIALVGVGVGVVAKLAGFVGVTTDRDMSVTNLKVGLTGTTAVANQEWLTYTTVASASAEYREDVDINIGPLHGSTPDEVYRQEIDPEDPMPFAASVLNKATDLTWVVESDNKVHIKFDPEAFTVKVYPEYQIDPSDPSHPFKNYFTSNPNWVAGIGGVLQSTFQAMPLPEGITPDEIDDIDESLQVAAVIAATEASAKACGPEALEEATPEIKEKLIETVDANISQSAAVLGVDQNTVDNLVYVVDDFPNKPNFESQYEGATEKLNETEGLDVKMPNYEDLSCERIQATDNGATS